MSQPVSASTIIGQFHCIQCGYQLAGLSPQSVCPECGTPVAESIKGDGLAFASVEYLRTIARGLSTVRWAALLTVLIFIGVVLANALLWAHLPSWWAAVGAKLVYLLPFGLNAVGWWLLAGNDPMLPPERDTPMRSLARYSAWVLVVAWAFRSGFAPLSPSVASVAEIVIPVVILAHVVAAGLFLRHLALRAPRRLIAARARRLVFAGIALVVLLAMGKALNYFGLSAPSRLAGTRGTPARWLFFLHGANFFIILGLMLYLASNLYSITGQLRADVRTFLVRRSPS